MIKSDAERAKSSKCTHSFSRRTGFLDHGAPLQAPPGVSDKACLPATKKVADGSLHRLAHESGKVLEFSWVAKEKAWERPNGNRLAWPAKYLAAHGWHYLGKVT